MLKYEGIKVGERIRAYDFQPMEDRDDMYVEGEIFELHDEDNYKAYVIVCDYDSSPAKRSRVGEHVVVPMGMTFDFDDRVVVL